MTIEDDIYGSYLNQKYNDFQVYLDFNIEDYYDGDNSEGFLTEVGNDYYIYIYAVSRSPLLKPDIYISVDGGEDVKCFFDTRNEQFIDSNNDGIFNTDIDGYTEEFIDINFNNQRDGGMCHYTIAEITNRDFFTDEKLIRIKHKYFFNIQGVKTSSKVEFKFKPPFHFGLFINQPNQTFLNFLDNSSDIEIESNGDRNNGCCRWFAYRPV